VADFVGMKKEQLFLAAKIRTWRIAGWCWHKMFRLSPFVLTHLPHTVNGPKGANPGWRITCSSLRGRYMGSVIVVPGDFEQKAYQYSIAYSLFVHPFYRELGVAIRLMIYAEELCSNKGFSELFLVVKPQNQEAISLYRKLGYYESASSAFNEFYQMEMKLYKVHVLGFNKIIKKG
jgi:ribosomal protein S18 acetylase RimI-like enzyme